MKKFWADKIDDEDIMLTHEAIGYNELDYMIPAKYFESLTGLKLKPGEIVQCELKVIKKG